MTGRLGGHGCPLNWNRTLQYLNINYLKPQPAAVSAQGWAEKSQSGGVNAHTFLCSSSFPISPGAFAEVTEAVSLSSTMMNPEMHVEDHFTPGATGLLATTWAACRPGVKIARPKFNFIQPRSVIVDNYWELINAQVQALADKSAVSLYLAREANMQSLLELLAWCYYTAEVACGLQMPQCVAPSGQDVNWRTLLSWLYRFIEVVLTKNLLVLYKGC